MQDRDDLLKKTVAAFDFDGTITNKDTFFDFAKFSVPALRFWAGVALFSPLLAMVVLKLTSGGAVKEKIFSFYYRDWPLSRYQKVAQAYCDRNFEKLVRPRARESIKRHLDAGDRVLIVSASTQELIKPFAICIP